MERGGLPSIESGDYDCALPSNLDDGDRDSNKHFGRPTVPKPMAKFKECSTQILLIKTIPIRLKVVKLIDSMRSELSLEDALALSAELSSLIKNCTTLIHGYRTSHFPPNIF